MAVLMNKKTPVLELSVEKGIVLSIGKVLSEEMLPIQLQDGMTLDKVNDWFGTRHIPEKREGLKEARLRFHGFDEMDRTYFSLTDQYWIRNNKNDTWEKGNFFTNRYSTEVGDAFFEPWNVRVEKLSLPSPDRTTNGVLRKCWRQDETGRSYLYKAGSIVFRQEPLSEVMASLMLGQLGLNDYVAYELVIHGMRMCSRCRNFVTANTEFVPASAIFNKVPRPKDVPVYDHFLRLCEKHKIIGAKDFVDRMITCDRIICNIDRHFGNFGFIRSAEDGRILGFAPLFDYGSAYWGTTNKVEARKSRLFPEYEKEILAKAAKKGLLKNARAGKNLYQLLDAYPDVSKKKKEAIKAMIKDVNLELERLEGSSMNEKDKRKDVMEIEYS